MNAHPLQRLVIPVTILLIGISLRGKVIELMPVYGQLLSWLPYAVLGSTMLLCIYYKRSLQLSAALLMLICYFLIRAELQVPLDNPRALSVYTLLSMSIPVALLLLLLLPEKGLLNLNGMLAVAAGPLLLLTGILILRFYPAKVLADIFTLFMPIRPFPGYILSVNASMLFLVDFLAGILLLYKKDNEITAAIMAVILFCYVLFVLFDRSMISTVIFSTAGLAMIIGLMQSTYNMAYRDELTGLLSRRALNERLKGLGKKYVIAMMDVDHFKKFNDTYGHDIGDEVLKMVAARMSAVRGGGIAYRYGGEEFCIIFPGRDMEYSQSFLEEVRTNIAHYSMLARNRKQRPDSVEKGLERRGRRAVNRDEKTVSVTISIGMAAPADRHNTPAAVLKAADKALYKAKKNGRNCLAW
jgi:diguanylate cyclase (GGDEF)-like protein